MRAIAEPSSAVRLQVAIKHFIDRVASALLCVLLLPVGAVIALLILLEDGRPVFFVQERLGKAGRPFRMLKFRSMRVNSAVVLNEDGSTRVDQVDPRVTRVGTVLRRTSLDELPQLVNVLLGQMSLVGPRPDLSEHLGLYDETDRLKLRMRPGVTGLPQVMGRNGLPWKDRIRLDNEYIDQYSLALDFSILVRTMLVVVTGRGVIAKGGNM